MTAAAEGARERASRRIRKLLKLGESSNVHEAAAAIAQAQRLMTRHAIQEAELRRGEDEPVEKRPATTRRVRTPAWETFLLGVLAEPNGCTSYRQRFLGGERGWQLWVAGRHQDVDLVLHLFVFCRQELRRLARELATRRTRASFLLGGVAAITEAVERERERAVADARAEGSSSSALAVVDQRAVRAERALGPMKRHRHRARVSDPFAFGAGKAAGGAVWRRATRPGIGR